MFKNTLIILPILLALNSQAQYIPIRLAIADESISPPNFWFLKYEYNPAILIGTEIMLQQKNKHDWHLACQLGYFYHKNWESATWLQAEIVYRYHIKRFSISPKLGIGYAHTFSPKPVYRYQGDRFKKVIDYGNPTFMGSFNLELAFKLAKRQPSPEVFIFMMESVEVPFNTYTGYHQFVGLGYKFYIKLKSEE